MTDYYKNKRQYVGQLRVDPNRTWEHGLGYYDVTLTGKAVGDFHMSQVEGYSAKEWYHGEKYIGQVHQNKKDGYGVHIWPSGARFYGQFKGNQPAGYGVLETVHEGIKFIGKVQGFVAEDIGPGQWYLNNQPVDVEDIICNEDGIAELEPNKWLNPVGDVIEKFDDGTVRTTEKNLITEIKEQGPYKFEHGYRDTTMYGDWIKTFRGHFLSGRYHGFGIEQRLGGDPFSSNWICGSPVKFETYSNLAFSTQNETRSVERRMSRRYCAMYDMVIRHVNSFKPKDLVIMEFGIGKGEHLQFLRELFPDATIVGVDKLTLDHMPDTELEKQQLEDLKLAIKRHKDVNIELGIDCYSKKDIYHLVNKYGKIGIGIHDATHGAQAWNQLDTIIECMNPQHGVIITEEMCCKDGEPNLRELKKAIDDGWRVFDFNPLTHGRYTDSLIGIRCFEHVDTDALSSYEIN